MAVKRIAGNNKNKASDTPSHLPALLTQRARASKGGVIGTAGRGVVAIRFDDWQADFGTKVWPLMTARALPASMALISRWQTAQPWGAGITPATIKSWVQGGLEIWSHGVDHLDPTPKGYAGLVEQIVTSKAELENLLGVKVQGWAQPGATPVTAGTPYGVDWTRFSDFNSDAGRLIVSTYGLSEMYVQGVVRTLPCGMYHGLDHATLDQVTLATAKGWVDTAIQERIGVEFMLHAGNLDKAGYMSTADFTALLDYIVAARDAGTLEVLTPSGLMFADASTSQRLDLMPPGTGSFNTAAGWATIGSGHTIETSGGRTGANFLRIPNTSTSFTTRRALNLQTMGMGGETFMFEGWARTSGANAVARVLIQDYLDTSRLNISKTQAVTAAWTRIRIPFTLPVPTDRLTIGMGRGSGDGVDWDDVSVVKV